MKGNNFGKIWIVTAILFFFIEYGLGEAIRASMANNHLLPWEALNTHHVLAFVVAAIAGSFAFTHVFFRGYRGGGTGEGVVYGLWITLLAAVPEHLVMAGLLPLGRRLPGEMMIADLITLVVCGAVAGAWAGGGVAVDKAAGQGGGAQQAAA